jgi:glycine oxidase
MMSNPDVIVVGGGVIGLSIAWRVAQRGLRVNVIDPHPGGGASRTAAGMLAPVTELHYEGRELLALNLESARRYPAFAMELLDATGLDVGYRDCGTVQAAWDAADLAELRALQAFQASLGVRSEILSSRELRLVEPALAAGLPGGLFAPEDHQVDNRALVDALIEACRRDGVVTVRQAASSIDGDTVTLDNGGVVSGAVTVLAAGAWSRGIDGLKSPAPVRPVKGQTLRLKAHPELLHQVVRGSVRGNPVYIVPRVNGELVIGASSEESGFDLRPRAGAVYDLLRDAQTLIPELSEAEFVEVSTSIRPGSPDNAPLLGRSEVDRVVLATGHYRNGILLTPVTADEISALIVDGVASDVIAPFTPNRLSQRDTNTTADKIRAAQLKAQEAHA